MTDYRQRLLAHMRTDAAGPRAEAPVVKMDGTTAVIRLYDAVDSWGDWFGISAREFAEVIDDLPDNTTEINLLINSPGGEVTEGIAILNLLRNHPARTVAVVEGVAASAASFIAAGCDELIMSRNSTLMVHSPWVLCIGDAQDMRSTADTLDSFEENIASIYAAKADGTVDEWREVMHAETWFTAEEAVEAGLADQVNEPDEDESSPSNRWDLSIFNFAGRDQAPEPKIPAGQTVDGSPQPPAEGGSAVAFSDEQLTDLRSKLGVEADADEDAILAAVDDLLDEATAPSDPPDPAPAASLPEGVVTVDSEELAQLRADAQAGREARAQQMEDRRATLVDTAIRDGRIPPARKDHWLNQLAADPGAEQVLANLEPGLVPVGEPIGANGVTDLDSDDALYAQLFGQEASA